MELSKFIHLWRKEHGYTMQEFADKAGLTKGFISQLENDFRNNKGNKKMMPSLSNIKKLAYACDMSLNDFLNAIDTEISLEKDPVPVQLPFPVSTTNIPLYDEISCGTGLFVDDQITEMFTIPTSMLPNKHAEYFAQTAHGDSMTGAGIKDGDILIFKKTSSIDNGQIGCFCIDDNVATCKKFSQNGGSIFLMPANDKYQPIPIEPENQCFRVIGLLVAQVSKR